MSRSDPWENVPLGWHDDDSLTPGQSPRPERPRRIHGSRRLSDDPLTPQPIRVFNLRPALDELPEEQPLAIEVNGRPVAHLLWSAPGAEELALGWAFSHGLFEDPARVRKKTAYRDRVSLMIDGTSVAGTAWQRLLVAGFDAGVIVPPAKPPAGDENGDDDADEPTDLRLPRPRLLAICDAVFRRFREINDSGCLHFAAVSDGHQVCRIAHDLSRHNAVDKIVGWTLEQPYPRHRLLLCLSGRVGAGIVFKAIRAGFPIVATSATPTADAVELAHQARITLVGRVLENRPAIYSHPRRLMIDDDES